MIFVNFLIVNQPQNKFWFAKTPPIFTKESILLFLRTSMFNGLIDV